LRSLRLFKQDDTIRVLHAVVLAIALVGAHSSFAIQLKDDRGVLLDVHTPPARVIVLSPHLAELVFAAGAGAQLAAVVRYSDYPEAAAKLPQVGDASRVDIERVLAIRPDLVLAWRSGNPAGDLARLEKLGIPLFVTEPRRLSDIGRLLRTLGTLAGTGATAERAAASFAHELESLRVRYSSRAPVRVFYEIWHRPLLTVNGRHLISDVVKMCGGVNIFSDAPLLTPAVSLEAVIAAKPDVVLGGSSASSPEELVSEWRRAPIAALREIPVRYVPPDLIQRQTPRIAQGARAVCEQLDAVRADALHKR
jgi:iron complex transport system substrate-binding protein